MDAQEPDGPGAGATPATVTSSTSDDVEPATVPLGAPGLSYRYVRTFGESTKAYLPDTQHINYPYGIGTDGTSLWVGEMWGNRLLKYDSEGNIQALLGQAGFAENNDDTSFWDITDVTVDSDGNIWAVDNAHRAAKLTPTGEKILELGVPWEWGTDNNHFDSLMSVAVDGQGNVYVSDGAPWWNRRGGNHRVQIFRNDGSYRATIGQTDICGTGNNQLCGPRHIAISGNQLYIADAGNDRVQIFNINTPDMPTYVATISNLNTPSGVAVDNTYIYVADTGNSRVVILDRTSRALVTTLGTGWGAGNDQFSNPTDVVVDNSGNLYVADFVNTRVQQFARTGNSWGYIRTYGVTRIPYLTDGYHYNRPSGVAVGNDGSIHVAEDNGHRLVKLSADGVPLWTVGAAGVKGDWNWDNDRLNNPADVAVNASGRVYIASRYHGRVPIYNADGSYHATIYELNCPGGVSTDSNGRVYVADSCEHVVKVYDTNLSLIATLGVAGESSTDNAHFSSPEDVAVDSTGRIYVADHGNHRIQVFNADRSYLKTLGESGQSGYNFAHFGGPQALFIDANDRLYVAEMWNDRLQVFDVDGNYLTTIGGNWGGTTGRLRGASGVSVDAAGNVYIADWNNHRIQKFAPGVPGWQQANINGFGTPYNRGVSSLEVFNGHLYAGATNFDSGGTIWRTSNGAAWTQVSSPGFSSPFTKTNAAIIDLATFNGQLYASTGWGGFPGQLWRTNDGLSWQQVASNAFGTGNGNAVAIAPLAIFNNRLYAGTCGGSRPAQIWRSDTGDSLSWTNVVTNGNDSPNSRCVTGFVTFGANLYAAVENGTDGMQIWRSSTGDSGTWNRVNTNGFGSANNSQTGGFAVFNGHLYIGTRNNATGAQLWRSQNGTEWSSVTNNGFGDSNNQKLDLLFAYEDALFVGFNNPETGVEIWRSTDGMNWQQINVDGFGDSNNDGLPWSNGVVSFKDSLYLGTWNWGNGGEIWQLLRQVYLPTLQR
jgi:hypothetical protein